MALSVCEIDIIRRITSNGNGRHEYVLVVVDYFTKWMESASDAKITLTHMVKFIIHNIMCRYGVPHELINDHGSHLKEEAANY